MHTWPRLTPFEGPASMCGRYVTSVEAAMGRAYNLIIRGDATPKGSLEERRNPSIGNDSIRQRAAATDHVALIRKA